MKKAILLLSILSILTISGCKGTNTTDTPITQTDENDSQVSESFNTIEASDDIDTSGYNLVSEYAYDFDSDGEEDSVSLYSTAAVIDGEIESDDGQEWLVTVKTSGGTFELFNERIQLGDIQLDIGELYNEESENAIILTLTTSASKSITHYVYRDDCFIEQPVYSTDDYASGGINIVKTIKK